MGGSSSRDMSAPFVVAAQARHTATLIFLHGLGDTGQGWSEVFKQMKLKHIRCVCPTAPVIPVTLNAGFKMPSWFDIMALSPDGPEDERGIKAAREKLLELVAAEEKDGKDVFLGGFSQGGALALYTALTTDKPIAGVVGLSCWLPLHKEFPQAFKPNRDIPMYQCHGTQDPLVPQFWGELTGTVVKKMIPQHTYKTYPMAHTSCEEEMEDVKNFLNELTKDKDKGQETCD